jgi:hypothetical protein
MPSEVSSRFGGQRDLCCETYRGALWHLVCFVPAPHPINLPSRICQQIPSPLVSGRFHREVAGSRCRGRSVVHQKGGADLHLLPAGGWIGCQDPMASRPLDTDLSGDARWVPTGTCVNALHTPRAPPAPAGPLAGPRRCPHTVRGRFAYVDGELEGDEVLPLCRMRFSGSASLWGFLSTWPAGMATKTRSCRAD